jgi:hypothetical protein
MRIRGAIGAVILIAGAALAACSSGQRGDPVAQDWTVSPVYGALRSIPATAASKFEIGLVSASRLNALDADAPTPKATTAPRSGLRPPSENAWINYAIAGSVCTLLESTYDAAAGYRTGPPGDMLSIYYGSVDTGQTLGVCQGDTDPTELEGKQQKIGAVDGYDLKGIWLGRHNGLTFQFGDKIPDDLRSAILSGTAAGGSLADDPEVRAVLDATPQAAAVEMGRIFVGIASFRSSSPLHKALDAVTATQDKALPDPTFGGYGWTSTSGLTGTGTFVTRYGSATDASTAAALLTAVWPKATGTPFADASTTSDAETVVTRVPNVKVTDFNLRNLRVADYPGYGGKRGN